MLRGLRQISEATPWMNVSLVINAVACSVDAYAARNLDITYIVLQGAIPKQTNVNFKSAGLYVPDGCGGRGASAAINE